MKYEILSSSKKINNVEIKNRVVMTAMGTSMAGVDGTATEEIIKFYEERAKGGVGLIFTEITRINDEHGPGLLGQLSVTKDSHIEGLKKLTDAVHKWGSKIFIQLHHPGRQTYSLMMDNKPVVAPSAIPCGVCKQETRALEIFEIKGIVQDFINGARRSKEAGADGVEIHGAHGYLLTQFLSTHTNKREDEYGGTLENRFRIVKEIIEGIKKECGENFPVSVRLSVTEFLDQIGVEDGITPEDGVAIAIMCEAAGADLINVSSGLYETMNTIIEPTSFQQGWRTDLARAVKANVKIPVLGNSVIREPKFAEELLKEGRVDFIGMGRTHLGDPEWTNKALEGRESEIRKCVSCLRCFESLLINGFIPSAFICSINPRLGKETKFNEELEKDGEGKVVAIIGAGPAGLENAVTLARRNFKPVLFEKGSRVGGQLLLAKEPPLKDKIQWLVEYYEEQIKINNIELRLNTEATTEMIEELNPYAVVVATGATPLIPKSIEGITLNNVFTTTEILTKEVSPKNETVAVIGSGMTGIETAEYLAKNNKVIIVEMADEIAKGCYVQNVMDVMSRLNNQDVELLPNHKLVAIRKNKIELENAKGDKVVKVIDKVVLSLGIKSENSIVEKLKCKFVKVYNIGDSNSLGRIAEAVSAGYELGYKL